MKQTTHVFDEKNIEFLRTIMGDEKVDIFLSVDRRNWLERFFTSEDVLETYHEVKKAYEEMERFGENRWWLSEDKRVRSYYQISCSVLLVPIDLLFKGFELVLERKVYSHEFYLNPEGLKREIEEHCNFK